MPLPRIRLIEYDPLYYRALDAILGPLRQSQRDTARDVFRLTWERRGKMIAKNRHQHLTKDGFANELYSIMREDIADCGIDPSELGGVVLATVREICK